MNPLIRAVKEFFGRVEEHKVSIKKQRHPNGYPYYDVFWRERHGGVSVWRCAGTANSLPNAEAIAEEVKENLKK